ncbi:MAG TPA: hypothetical protein VFH55_03060 [Nitrospiria bacterium]|nr:hypothetical protein [Nitrospiria bacterium]
MNQRMVVHFQDGQIVKGNSHDFFPNKDVFHLNLLDQPPSEKPMEISVSQLKAIFFVKDFWGQKERKKRKGFAVGEKSPYGKKVVVQFKDKEQLYGFTQGYSATRPGFFLFPAEPQSNNEKIFVVRSFVTKIEFVD